MPDCDVMASGPRSIRHCLICGIAMLASKSNRGSVEFDTFNCLNCKATISLAPDRTPSKPSGSDPQ